MLQIWIAVIIIAVILEIITVDLVSIWFGAGALGALIAYLLGATQEIQIITCLAITIICLIFTRPLAKKYMKTNTVRTNYDRIIGKQAVVISPISPNQKGEVKVLSAIWSAVDVDNGSLAKNEFCEVIAIEGAHVIVRKLGGK